MASDSIGEIVSFIGDPVTTALCRAFAVESAEALDVRLINLADLQPTSVAWGQRRAAARLAPAMPADSVRREDVMAMAADVEILTIDAPTWDVDTAIWLARISLLTVVTTGIDEHELDNAQQFVSDLAGEAAADRVVLALCRVGLDDEAQARSRLEQSGCKLLKTAVAASNSFQKLQNEGRAISETPVPQLAAATWELVKNIQAEYIAAQDRRQN